MTDAKSTRKRAADALFGDLKRQFTAEEAVADTRDAIILPPGETERRLVSVREGLEALQTAERVLHAAAEKRRRTAERREALLAKYGHLRTRSPRLEDMPDGILRNIIGYLGRKERLAACATCIALLKFIRPRMVFDRISTELDAKKVKALNPGGQRMSTVSTCLSTYPIRAKELCIYVSSDVYCQEAVPCLNQTLAMILGRFTGYATLRVLPQNPADWPKNWWLPPVALFRACSVRVFDSPFLGWLSPSGWIMSDHESTRPLVLPTRWFSNAKANRLWDMMLCNSDGVCECYYPRMSCVIALCPEQPEHQLNFALRRRGREITRLVLSGTVANTVMLSRVLALEHTKSLRTIQLWPHDDRASFCLDAECIEAVCARIARIKRGAAPGDEVSTIIYIPLAPLATGAVQYSVARNELLCKWFTDGVLRWYITRDIWDCLRTGKRRPDKKPCSAGYAQVLLKTLFTIAQLELPLIEVENSAEHELQPVAADEYVAMLSRARKMVAAPGVSDEIFDVVMRVARGGSRAFKPIFFG
jgi:hypothetical protein